MKIKKYFLSHQSTRKLMLRIIFTLVGLSASMASFSQEEIGVAAAVNTTTTDNFYDSSGMFAERRLVEEGYKIIQDRTIETDEKGKAQMILIDGTAFTIGPNSRVILDKFVYNPETNDGFLEMQATGLLRLVGGKVTKKNAATINTTVATVGIRGGIVIVDSDNDSTSAAFVYGQEMEVTPLQNQGGRTVLTEDGFVVEVNDPYDDIETPELLTAETLAGYSAGLEGREEEEEEEDEESESEEEESEEEESEEESEEEESEEEESEEEESEEEESEEESEESEEESEESEEESSEEESTEEESTEEESTEEESTEEESTEDQNKESGDNDDSGSDSTENEEETSSDDSAVDDGAQEDSGNESQEDSGTLENEETEATQPIGSDAGEEKPAADTETPDVGRQEDGGEVDLDNEFNEVGDDREEPEIVIDEDSLLTDSGISDNSSNVAPDQLTTSDDIGGELGNDLFEVEQEEDPSEETAEEVEETTSDVITTDAADKQTETAAEEMSARVIVQEEFFVESAPKNTLVATTAVEGNGMTYALEDDFGVFKVNKKGKIRTKSFLDFETDEKYDLVLLVTNSKGKVIRVPFTINIADISELSATATVRAASFHEGTTKVNRTLVDMNPVADETPTYEITGEGKEYFRINKNGKIKLNKSLNYSAKNKFDLIVKVTSGTESVDVPVTINVRENLAPDFSTACQSSCSLAESAATGTVVIKSTRTDTDIDDLTYTLENDFGNKFSINPNTGQVTLNSALDYETTNSYTLKVIATDSKGITKDISSTFNVTDVGVGYTGTLVSASQAESITSGTVILNSALGGSFSNPTYSISGGNNKFAINSSTGQVTLANALDYETNSSHTFTITAQAGGESESQSFTLNVSDVSVGYSGTLVQGSQAESIATGTVILNSALGGSFSNPTYSISGGNNKFAIDASTGQVTLTNALDYETNSSHTFTITAQAGGETETQNFTLNVSDVSVGYSGTLVQGSQAESIATGTVILNSALGGSFSNPTYSIYGGNGKFAIDASTGQVTLANALDYETAAQHTFSVRVEAGGEVEAHSFTLNVGDVGVGYTGTLVADRQSEHLATGSVILNSALGGSFSSPTYSMSGGNGKFAINPSTGQVTLINPLDYETKTFHQFSVTASAGGESETQSFTMQVIDVRTTANIISNNGITVSRGYSGSAFRIGEFSPVGTVVSNANSGGATGVTWSISGSATDKLQIDSSTGQVTLKAPLDYETANTHSYQVTATKNGESTISGVITFRVDDEMYSAHGMFPENARDGIFLSVHDGQLGGSINDNRVGIFAAYDIGDKSASEKKLFALDNGLPAGTTFNCSLNAMTSFCGDISIDAQGNMSVGSSSFFSVNNPYPGFDPRQLKTSVNASGKTTARENAFIGFLTGKEQYGAAVTKKIIGHRTEIPNEPSYLAQTQILPKATELNENVVMRFSSKVKDGSVVHNKTGANPFTATATRGPTSYRHINGHIVDGHGLVTESALSTMDLESSTKIEAANRRANGSQAHIAQHAGGKSYYRTNTVANGNNEADISILDFEYRFPIDKTSGDDTFRQYAPLSVANGQWDSVNAANGETGVQPYYHCYDSGQGCGSETHGLTLSGNMEVVTGGQFTGYKVIQSNATLNDNLFLNADIDGENPGNGTYSGDGAYNHMIGNGRVGGFSGFKLGDTNDQNYSEFETIELPQTFKYFGQNFTHIYVNENGFLTFGTGGSNDDKPWHNYEFDGQTNYGRPYLHRGGGVPIMYLDDNGGSNGSNHGAYSPNSSFTGTPNDLQVPDVYGKPGTDFEGNLNNTIFALWADYYNDSTDQSCNDNGCNEFRIQRLWNPSTGVMTIGWYKMKSHDTDKSGRGANFEIQLKFDTGEFKIVLGDRGPNFPDTDSNNVFTGFSKDVTCATATEDISSCEGKDYVQLYYHDSTEGEYETPSIGGSASFQDPTSTNRADQINVLYNSYFSGNQTVNGTEYCNASSASNDFGDNPACSNSVYFINTAKTSGTDGVDARIYRAVPQYAANVNRLLPSDVNQSYRAGLAHEFMWMHLNNPATTLKFTPPAAGSSFSAGPNSYQGVGGSGDTPTAGSEVDTRTFNDEIVIGGEVYKTEKLMDFLQQTKKVIAYAPVPILHTNQYELAELATENSGSTDARHKRVHTLMPHFISTEYMEDKDNGTDALFDFHQLVDHDYSKSGAHLRYDTIGSGGNNNFGNANLNTEHNTEAVIDGTYAYAGDVLDHNTHVSSLKHTTGGVGSAYDLVPEGQSLWQQIFNPAGRGPGLFVQMNWSCGHMGVTKCGESGTYNGVGFTAGKTNERQQSLFSVLIAEVGDKTFFPADYFDLATGAVMQGEHYWSYSRRSGRTTTSDGAYATTDAVPQVTFGINPISCISGQNNGCFFGDDQGHASSTIGAPSTAIVSTSDPCVGTHIGGCREENNMKLGVMHSMEATTNPNDPHYKTGTFYQGIVQQQQRLDDTFVDAINLSGTNSWREGQATPASFWTGRMSGLFITDDSDTFRRPLYWRSESRVTFDDVNDRVQVEVLQPEMKSIIANNSNGDNDWYRGEGAYNSLNSASTDVSTGEHFIFGKADKTSKPCYNTACPGYSFVPWTKSAYLNKQVFGAMLRNDSKSINSAGTGFQTVGDNAGAIVTWETIDNKDRDFMMDNTTEPSLEYMTWGVWGLAMSDSRAAVADAQPAAVHMGGWYAGDLLDISDWPVSRTATLAGMAMFDVFARFYEGGSDYRNYHWTEGTGVTGQVVFDGVGRYTVSITADNLGKSTGCAGLSSSCEHGLDPFMGGRGAIGSVTWTSGTVNAGVPHFSRNNVTNEAINRGLRIATKKSMQGHLFGTSSHVEVGANLEFSRETNNQMIMMSGTAVLSE